MSKCQMNRCHRRRNVRAVWPGVQPASQGLPRQQAGHLHAGAHAGPVDERDGPAVVVIVHRALGLLRRVRHDPVALAAAGVDDRRVQHVRAEVADVEDDRARVDGGGGAAASATATATGSGGGPGESPEDRRLLVARGPVAADAPALHVRIEVCGHWVFPFGGWGGVGGCSS